MKRLYRLTAAERDRAIARLDELLGRRPEIAFATVFGSVLESDAVHDVDVAIWMTGAPQRNFDLDLADTLSRDLALPVDVRRMNDAPIPIRFHMLRGRPIAVHDERQLADLMEQTAREYHDRAERLRRATREAYGR